MGAAATGAAALVAGSPFKASAAGEIVIYSTTHPAVQERLIEAFTAKTGITVQSMRLNTSAIAQRFLAEQEAGQHLVDVVTLGNVIFMRKVAADGLITDLSGRPGVSDLDPFWRPHTHFVKITASPGGIAYNPNMVPADQLPTSWQDLLRPEFKGQIIMTDPRTSETLVPFVAMLRDVYGDDFLRQLGQQDLRLAPVTQQGVEQVAAGEAAFAIPCNPGNLERYEGENAPVRLIADPKPPTWTSYFAAIPTHAPNPEGAATWFDFVMSREGQEILCKNVSVSPLADIPGALPTPEGELSEPDLEEALKVKDELLDLLDLPA